MPDGEGEDGAGEELRVVIGDDVSGGGVTEGYEEAEAAANAEEGGEGESGGGFQGDEVGMVEGEEGAQDQHDEAAEEGHAFGGFGLGENAGPDDVGGEAEDADEAGQVADRVPGLPAGAGGVDGDDHADEADDDGEAAAEVERFLQEEGCQKDGDDRGKEDQDVEEREREVAKGDDDAEIVGEVEAGAEDLLPRRVRPEMAKGAAADGVGEEEENFEEADDGYGFGGGEVGGGREFEAGVGEYPEGVRGEGEEDGAAGGDGICDCRGLARGHEGVDAVRGPEVLAEGVEPGARTTFRREPTG